MAAPEDKTDHNREKEEIAVRQFFQRMKEIARKNRERERSIEPRFEAASRSLWPWAESRLLGLVCCVAALDYVSTYAVLELSGKTHVYEGGLLAAWALREGGFMGLLLFDIAAASVLVLTAITIRYLHSRFGFKGYGRTAFVFILVPYVVVTMAAIFNNVALTFV